MRATTTPCVEGARPRPRIRPALFRIDSTAALRRIAAARRGLLIATAFAIPVLFVPGMFLDAINVPKLALLAIGTAAALALRLVEMGLRKGWGGLRLLAFPAGALGVPLTMAWLLSPYRSWSLLGEYSRFQGLAPYLIVIVFGVLLADACADRPVWLAWALSSSGAFIGAYALVQMLGLDPFAWALEDASWASSTLGHTNFTGGFLAIVLPCALYLWMGTSGRRWPAMLATVLIVEGLILANSQGGWAAGIAGAAVFAGEVLRGRFSFSRLIGVSLAGLVALAVTGGVVLAMLDSGNRSIAATAHTRSHHWQRALDVAAQSPVVGRGPDAFALEGMMHRSPEDAVTVGGARADDPHSVPLAMLANAGMLGLLGYGGVFFWVVRRARRARSVAAAPFVAALAAYFTQSLVSIDELSLRVALWVALAGIAVTTVRGASSSKYSSRLDRSAGRSANLRAAAGLTAAVMLVVGTGAWTARFLAADARARQGSDLFEADRVSQASVHLEAALALRQEKEYREILGMGLGLAALKGEGRDENLIFRMREAFDHTDSFPDLRGAVSYAHLLGGLGAFDPAFYPEALAAFERARDLDPYNPLILSGMADALVALDRPDEAVSALEVFVRALRSGPSVIASGDMANALGALATAHLQAGDPFEARKVLDHAKSLGPGSCRVMLADELLTADEQHASYRPDRARLLNLRLNCNPSQFEAMVALLPEELRPAYR